MGNHPQHLIIGDYQKWVTRRSLRNKCNNLAFVSQVEPKRVQEALVDEYWVMAMHEELNQFKRNNLWYLVPKLDNQTIIRTRWVFRNNIFKPSTFIRNKARLIAKGYNQEKGIDYDETFTPIA